MTPTERPSFIPERSDLFIKVPKPQALAAWAPFWECVEMNFLLQNSDLDDEHPEWRMHWVYGVTMLRTVGHVLDKVDGVRSNLHRSAVSSFWRNWKSNRMQHWVFWEFIEQERNNLLKTFNFGVELDEQGLWYPSLEMDGVQLLREATYWWRRQLEELEEKLGV